MSRWVVAGLSLGSVELLEATDGFGGMAKTYDAWDFVANAVGGGLAAGADVVVERWVGRGGKLGIAVW